MDVKKMKLIWEKQKIEELKEKIRYKKQDNEEERLKHKERLMELQSTKQQINQKFQDDISNISTHIITLTNLAKISYKQYHSARDHYSL